MKQFQKFLKKLGYEVKIFPENTATAVEAAIAIECDVSQIAKSLVFKTDTNKPILVICSGSNRVDLEKVARIVGEKIEKADADFCLAETGFTIGGIPPFGHSQKLETLIDKDLRKFDFVWAAAGTIRSVFKISFEELVERSKGKVMVIC